MSSQTYRSIPAPGEPLILQDGDPIVIGRAGLSIEEPHHWTTTLYIDNLNNERGSPVRAFVGADNYDARVRPRTIGLQIQYRFK